MDAVWHSLSVTDWIIVLLWTRLIELKIGESFDFYCCNNHCLSTNPPSDIKSYIQETGRGGGVEMGK